MKLRFEVLMKQKRNLWEWKFAQDVWLFKCNETVLLMPHRDIFAGNLFLLHVGKTLFTVFENIKVCQVYTIHLTELFYLFQNLPSCSINIQSFQKLPKLCSTWSLWCKENEEQEGNCNPSCDQSTSQSSASLSRVPPKLPRHHRKMPFRRRNWCGCIQVSKVSIWFHDWRFSAERCTSGQFHFMLQNFRHHRQKSKR